MNYIKDDTLLIRWAVGAHARRHITHGVGIYRQPSIADSCVEDDGTVVLCNGNGELGRYRYQPKPGRFSCVASDGEAV